MKRFLLLIVVAVRAAHAQPAPDAPAPAPVPMPTPMPDVPVVPEVTPPDDTPVLVPTKADRATCLLLDTTPGALLESVAPSGQLDTPIPWSEFVVDGDLVDGKDTVHALLEPTMQEHRTNLSNSTWKEIAAVTAKFGYQLVGHVLSEQPNGPRLVLHLAPLPMVRKVSARVSFGGFGGLFDKLLEDEVKRRMRVRAGSYLPWEPIRRQCELIDERQRILDFLYDEGYADAEVRIVPALERASANLAVRVDLGEKYKTGTITIGKPPGGEVLAISDDKIKELFHHCAFTLGVICAGEGRFTRTQHQEDLQKVRELFHQRGYPTVRVQSSFDPRISFDRHGHVVNFTITVDQRRKVDLYFEGVDPGALPAEELRKQLTFDDAGSADDVEAAASAKALVAYLQGRGYFDARVTVERQRLAVYDKITFRIDTGPTREVGSVEFVGNHVIDTNTLRGLVATKEAGFRGSLLGTNTAATSAQLGLDVVRIQEAYRRAGYRDAIVVRSAATDPAGLDSTALDAALVLAEVGNNLFVRFRIDEGEPTLLSRIAVDVQAPPDRQAALCDRILAELAIELGEPQFATRDRTAAEPCVATAAKLAFKEDDAATTRDRLRDFLYRSGRPRASVDYETKQLGPHRVTAVYKVRSVDELHVGKVIVRGNFHTRDSIIYGELRLHEGDLLTTDALADGARRLRNTGLFNAVNIDLPDLCANQTNQSACASSSLVVNAVVRVEERYDYLAQVDLYGGYSSYNGLFVGGTYYQRNILGLGLAWTVTGTYGTKILDLESTFLIPQWLVRRVSPVEFRTELTGLIKQQDTPRFGLLDTEGATIALSRQWQRPHVGTVRGAAWTAGVNYDFRLRTREVDALRPIGVNMDEPQVAIGTRTGSIGVVFDWEERVDRHGALAPLSPEDGFRFEASAAYASPYLLGQDTFVKLSATGTRFIPIGQNLVLRGDLRYDEGIPLGGAVLLPEVERFFAGGDSTVRGYSDDRMATELIEVGVPPIGNLTQIRIIPAGGNIRVLGSLDAQLRIWKILAGALFTDAGMISNEWSSVTLDDIRPSVGMGLRALTPFGIGALEYAIPLRPKLGDDPRGRIHFYFAARAQF